MAGCSVCAWFTSGTDMPRSLRAKMLMKVIWPHSRECRRDRFCQVPAMASGDGTRCVFLGHARLISAQ